MRSLPNIPFEIEPQPFDRQRVVLSWASVEGCVAKVRYRMNNDLYTPKRIVALGRGAMIPARLIGREDIPIYYYGVKSYSGLTQGGLHVYQEVLDVVGPLDDRETLIVDDLWDTGETLKHAMSLWPKARIAALMSKKSMAETGPGYIGFYLPTSDWVKFPWEH